MLNVELGTWLVDDRRIFRDRRPARVFRSCGSAMADLRGLIGSGLVVESLWLDHDLGGDETAMPIVTWLAEEAFHGFPAPVSRVVLHSSNSYAREAMFAALTTPRIAGAYDAVQVRAIDFLVDDPSLPQVEDL